MNERRRYRGMIEDSARWDGFVLRDGDIIVTTPPKCGTTWTQMMCALLVLQQAPLPLRLDEISPWLDMLTSPLDDVVARLEAQDHRRVIKSHTPLDGLPWDERVTYVAVARDPRDVAMSWDDHVKNSDIGAILTARNDAVGLDDLAELFPDGPTPPKEDPLDRFWEWVDDDEMTSHTSNLRRLVHHAQGFAELGDRPNVVRMHYSDMRADPAGQMEILADRLGIDVPADLMPRLVDAADLNSMRADASRTAPDIAHHLWHDPQRFFGDGAVGRWESFLTAEDVARYDTRIASLASPELIAYLQRR